jgi:hypothetical protein
MAVTFDGDNLHVSAPRFHFLSGKPLERLKNGGSQVFLSQLTVTVNNTVLRRSLDRFIVSYDLWEETFSVTQMGAVRRSSSRLPAEAVENWCLDGLAIGAAGVPADRPFWVRLEWRAANDKASPEDPAMSLARLIELLSRKPGADEPQWTLEAGPLWLRDLPRRAARG